MRKKGHLVTAVGFLIVTLIYLYRYLFITRNSILLFLVGLNLLVCIVRFGYYKFSK